MYMLDVSFAGVLTTKAMEVAFDAFAVVHDCEVPNRHVRCSNFLFDNIAHQGVRMIDSMFYLQFTF